MASLDAGVYIQSKRVTDPMKSGWQFTGLGFGPMSRVDAQGLVDHFRKIEGEKGSPTHRSEYRLIELTVVDG